MKTLILIFILMFIALNSQAEKVQSSSWHITSLKKSVNESWGYNMSSELRYNLDEERMSERILKTGITYKTSPNHKLGLIYHFGDKSSKEESRIILQSQLNLLRLKGSRIYQRARLEGRDFKNPNSNALRARYRLGYDYKLSDSTKMLVRDEVFFSVADSRGNLGSFLNRNRFMLGLETKLELFSVGVAFINQYNIGRSSTSENIVGTSLKF